MKKLLILLAGVLVRQVVAAAVPDVTLHVTPERDLVLRDGPREVIVQVDLEGRRPDSTHRAPINLAVVLDRSGSMQGAKIEKARQAACTAIDHLADNDYFSMVIFDNDTEVLIAPDKVGGSRNREELKSRIGRISPRGGTAIHAGVTLGSQQVRRFLDKEMVNRVLLLSDGLANSGPSRPSDLASLGRDVRRDGISVTTVGVGEDYNEDLMVALAEASNANYYYVKDAEKLPGIFAEELGAVRSVVARSVTIRITVPEGVRLKEIIGRPEIECAGRTVDVTLPEYFGGDKRRFLARCVVETKPAESLQVASVDLKYEPMAGGKSEAQSQAVAVRFTDEEKKSDASLRPEVAREVSVVKNRLAKEEAVKLADQGRAKDAAEVLRQQAVSNAAAPAAAQVPGMAEENRKLNAAASEVEAQGGLSKSSRKGIQYENYQDKHQKR